MKHAYLIMAHAEESLLKNLLLCLDHDRVDIFIHLDKKSTLSENTFKDICRHANIYFTKRISVNWGGYSQIEAELILLEHAVSKGPYSYYHLLTGVDLPLKPQEEILNFFDAHQGKEFISIKECDNVPAYMSRVKYYHPFQESFRRNSVFGKLIKKALLLPQQFLKVNRCCFNKYGVGSAYFDITHLFAEYVLLHSDCIKRNFKMTCCADEIFLQTIFLNSTGFFRYEHPEREHPYIEDIYLDVLRAIDWTRGKPYVYKNSDYQLLMDSNCLFARKFSTTLDSNIINRIVRSITK